MPGQFFTAQGAAENRLRQFLFQHRALWAIADDDQFHLAQRIRVLQGFKAALEQSQVFLLRQSTYVQHGDLFSVQCPTFPQRVVAFRRVEQLAVDPARQHSQTLEIPPLQLQALTGAGDQRQRRAVMEPAQIVRDHAAEQAQTVLVRVLLEVGVKATDHADAQAPCCAQRRQAQWAFGGDVEHVGALTGPAAQQLMHRRLAPLQAGVARQRPAAAQQQRVIAGAALIAALAWAHQLDLMAARAQTFTQAAKGIGHPVDLWREGFGDQSDVKRSCRHDPQCHRGPCRHCVIGMMDL